MVRHKLMIFCFTGIFLFLQIATSPVQTRAGTKLTDQQKREAASKAHQTAMTTIGRPDYHSMLAHLRFHRYDALETYLLKIEKNYQADPNYEYQLRWAYRSLASNYHWLEKALDKWVEARGNYFAYCARGFYLSKQGWKARGGAYRKKTPEENFIKMDAFHSRARADLEKAIEMNPKLMPAYWQLIEVIKAAGEPEYNIKLINMAVDNDKRNYYPRAAYLGSLTPRWGGSYPLMDLFIQQAIRCANLNPRLWSFRGEIDADIGDLYHKKKNWPDAIKHYTRALNYGDRAAWLAWRAQCYRNTGQYNLELKDIERYLTYRPNSKAYHKRLYELRKELDIQADAGQQKNKQP